MESIGLIQITGSSDTLPTSADTIVIDGKASTDAVVHLDVDFTVSGRLIISRDDTLLIDNSVILTNEGTMTNFGSIENAFDESSTISNSGTITNLGSIGGLFNCDCGNITLNNNSDGTINTSGDISVIGTLLNNVGTLNNSGTIFLSFSEDEPPSTITNDGTLLNSGSIGDPRAFRGGNTIRNNLGATLMKLGFHRPSRADHGRTQLFQCWHPYQLGFHLHERRRY